MFSNIPSIIRHHYSAGTINFPMGIYITLVHVLAAVGATYVLECKPETIVWSFVLWWGSGLGITAGVHRLWSHRR